MHVGLHTIWNHSLTTDALFAPAGRLSPFGVDRPFLMAVAEAIRARGGRISLCDPQTAAAVDIIWVIDDLSPPLRRYRRANPDARWVYWAREPPVVIGHNGPASIPQLARHFDAVLHFHRPAGTYADPVIPMLHPWNDPSRIAGDAAAPPVEARCCNVSSNLTSDHPASMYAARRAVIRHFEREDPAAFAQYGKYWPDGWAVTRGVTDDKLATLRRYPFTLCFENQVGTTTYISEKIFDCFHAGSVPIYWGAEDVTDHIPQAAFIDYRRLGSPAALADHLSTIDPATHAAMVDAGRRFARSDERFTPASGAATVLGAFEAVLDGGDSAMTTAGLEELLAHAARTEMNVRPYIALLPPAAKLRFVASHIRPAAAALSQNPARVASYLRRYLGG